jgi:methionine sulfoxide reductase heme-binding subunit
MLPWTDRAGRFSLLKTSVLVLAILPAFYIAWRWQTGDLGIRPIKEALHETGTLAIRFLVASLAVTPLRHVTGNTRIVLARRLIGLSALGWALAHLSLYVVEQAGDLAKVASEIWLRSYLTIGFVALVVLCVLGATSFDGAIRRLGAERWRRIHLAAHAAAVLGLAHHLIQARLDVTPALVLCGLYLGLVLARGAVKARWPLSVPVLLGITLIAALATMGAEIAWYANVRRVPWMLMAMAQLDFEAGIRPVWGVVAGGIALVIARIATGGGRVAQSGKRSTRVTSS